MIEPNTAHTFIRIILIHPRLWCNSAILICAYMYELQNMFENFIEIKLVEIKASVETVQSINILSDNCNESAEEFSKFLSSSIRIFCLKINSNLLDL